MRIGPSPRIRSSWDSIIVEGERQIGGPSLVALSHMRSAGLAGAVRVAKEAQEWLAFSKSIQIKGE